MEQFEPIAMKVVNALSDRVVRDLLHTLIIDNYGNCGDVSTPTQFERVMQTMVDPRFGYKVDKATVRLVLAASASAHSMTIGGGMNDDPIVDLVHHTLAGTKGSCNTLIR